MTTYFIVGLRIVATETIPLVVVRRMSPVPPIKPFALPRLILGSAYAWWVGTLDVINARSKVLGATDARDATALDPYAFTREAYYQRRKFLIFDGDPPMDDFFDEFDDEE